MSDCGDWIQTFTGRRVYPLALEPADVAIEDIAHSLSLLCRFGGHCRRFYSVADHSLRLSYRVPSIVALLHDAAEAYLLDLPRPLKRSLPGYAAYEACAEVAIAERFKIGGEWESVWPAVKHADNRMLATEARALVTHPQNGWAEMPPPYDDEPFISLADPLTVEALFLRRFEELGGRR